jgi:hypothetical protein
LRVRGTVCATLLPAVKRFIRALLWATAILAPGGIILLPVLAGEALARKARPAPAR